MQRLELSQLVHRLKGNWKISENVNNTNFIIVDKINYENRLDQIPSYFKRILVDI